MATYNNPGVYVSESTLVNNVQRANTAQSIAAFIGTATRGPLTPTLINSWGGFKATYGDITTNSELGYSVYHYFANGGRDAYILRVLHTTATGVVGALSQGTTTFTVSGASVVSEGTYTGLTQSASNGPGTGAVFTITKTGSGVLYNGFTTVTITSPGSGYVVGNTITIAGANLGTGGITGTNNLILTIGGSVGEIPARLAASYVSYYPTGNGGAAANMFTAVAANPGAWGTELSITTSSSAAAPSNTTSSYPLFNVSVKLSGVEVEAWNEVSLNPADNRYILTVINNYSKFITVSNPAGATVGWAIKQDAGSDIFTFGTYSVAYGTTTVSSSVATDGTAVLTADYQSTVTQLDTIEGTLLINAPGQTSSSLVTTLLSVAETRGDSFVIIDPAAVTTVGTVTGAITSYPKSSYGAVYYPQLLMVDPTKTGPAAVRNTFPGGAVAGAYIRSEVSRTVAKAPAGYDLDIRNALGLTATFTSSEAGALYETYNVNLFKAIPGAGIVINGARTLNKSTPAKYIPIRRSLNYLKQALKTETDFAVFEPNDDRLWTRINMNVSALLSEFWRSGGLKGANADQAFYITCDETNNTTTTITNGEVHIEVGVALQYPAEFIIINLSQWTGGSNTVSTL